MRLFYIIIIFLFSFSFSNFAQTPDPEPTVPNLYIKAFNLFNLFPPTDNPPKAEEYYKQEHYEAHMKNLLKSIPFWKDDRVPDIFIATEVGGFNDGKNFIADELKEKLGFDGYFSTENGIPATDQDVRGIDVVVFYKNNPSFKNISVKYHNIVAHLRELHKNEPDVLEEIENHKTRPVVEVIFDMGEAGNFHVFGNHWPSQGGGG